MTPKHGAALMLEQDTFFLDQIKTPIGDMILIADRDGALRMTWFDPEDGRWKKSFTRHYPDAKLVERRNPSGLSASMRAYYEGDVYILDKLAVVFGGTPFQNKVWRALRTIPCGMTVSYGTLAKCIGEAKAVRAVGLANGSNPIGIVVPCHRVIGSDGSLTGYGGGLPRKRWLLAHEAKHTPSSFRLEATV
jgi:methylated-DNA-[protein]-cysteine S-methyltransferase